MPYLSKELEGALGEGEVVDEEDNDEGSEFFRGKEYGVAEHAHPAIKLEHLDELEGREEDDHGEDEAERLIPD